MVEKEGSPIRLSSYCARGLTLREGRRKSSGNLCSGVLPAANLLETASSCSWNEDAHELSSLKNSRRVSPCTSFEDVAASGHLIADEYGDHTLPTVSVSSPAPAFCCIEVLQNTLAEAWRGDTDGDRP